MASTGLQSVCVAPVATLGLCMAIVRCKASAFPSMNAEFQPLFGQPPQISISTRRLFSRPSYCGLAA